MKKNIYIFTDGSLRRKDNTVAFESELGRKILPIEDISEIFIFGQVDLNKAFLDYMSQKEIILHFFNYYGYYTGSFYPREHLNSGYMILKQAEYYLDERKRLDIALRIVEGASKNILSIIKYYMARGKELDQINDSINILIDRLKECKTTNEIMAIEGNIRETYYEAFDIVIDNKDFRFVQRTKRPPKNHLNALISFGNSMLYTLVLSEIYKTHLDPRIGFLHTTNFRRFTLNLDIAEIFKPIIVDRIIFTLLNKKIIQKDDFEKDLDGIMLKENAKKRFVEEFDKRLTTTIMHGKLGRHVSYRRLIRMELYKLEKHLIGEEEYLPFVSKW
ncbi:type I-B CRISPR-associated endonuclease Cas1b [Tepidimicrobium xylanilyticum]|uniref:type I-B CRISPR-associated endonuclease Cas1b n=1 Tax=Tepidimicrobium xylanilyticum TaxID=1123352 RepID=UPI00265035CA|nr:type I-B CRISPR-associated endonuclease Cas1b [Tepidimicrobium xylanilyticum]GMG97467.1 CRISPR-associated endonuclease Cas1 2 [Tepidimicrobium xylanilyticum]